MELEQLLMNEIREELDEIKTIAIGSEDSKRAIDGLTKLSGQIIEIRRLESEKELKEKQHQLEVDKLSHDQVHRKKQQIIEASQKTTQMKDEKKNNFVKNAITIGSGIASIGLAVWGTKVSFKFEEHGTITTPIGRCFIQRLLPKK